MATADLRTDRSGDRDGGPHHLVFKLTLEFLLMVSKSASILAEWVALSQGLIFLGTIPAA